MANAADAPIGAARGRIARETERRARYRPLGMMPLDLPARWEALYRRLAEKARTRYRDAVYLKCVDCAAWDRSVVRRCEITTCALWIHHERIFNTRGG